MSLSEQLINRFIETELELFKKQFGESPVPAIQDDRSLAIAWLCYYFKELVSNENAFSVINFVDEVYSAKNYCTHGYHRISALQAAAFILTKDIYYANSLIENIDCKFSLARIFVIKSVGIICPLISFDNLLLKEATENNIKNSHTHCESSVILYLSTQGKAEEKIKWLEFQISIDEEGRHKEFFSKLKKAGSLIQSGVFVSTFSRAKSYLLFKMLSQPLLAEFQIKLFDDVGVDFNRLVELETKHPLSDYFIDMGFLNNGQ